MNMFKRGLYHYVGVLVVFFVLIGFVFGMTGVHASGPNPLHPVIDITEETFHVEVEKHGSGLVLVDFWRPGCGICRQLMPVLNEVNQQIGDRVKVGKVDVWENWNLTKRFEVDLVPTLILFKNGERISTKVGFQSKEQLLQWIADYL